MDKDDIIIDISSDDENSVDESLDISEEWLNELLGSVDVEQLKDLDDVVFADELSTPSFMKKPSLLQKESDEDCLILDCDPDKVMPVVDGENEAVNGCADLLIVGEKGHLACRDYPHPRHLCVSFPFSSTPHEKHCKLCHCYVCDSIAPCIYWGYGLLKTDHCHASEKEQNWKSLRNCFKQLSTKFSEPLRLSHISQSNTQPFQNFQNIYRPSSGLYSIEQLNSIQLHRTSFQSFLSSEVLQGSQRTPQASLLPNSQSIQPEAPKNMQMIRDMLASVEADLLSNDYSIGSASRNMDVCGAYVFQNSKLV